ncbi:MAG: hypothetical protein IPN36_14745 [Bacteroidetes bacterium]|nr:hypothetical protein [Bacteroidota bacterium]
MVPEGASTGPVRIKINDDKALSSDEIPDFNEPVFTFDHYVELVAEYRRFKETVRLAMMVQLI